MQVTEVAADGLKREFKVVVAANEIEGKVEARLKKMAKTAKVPGFRPGKVPLSLLKRQYGRQLMGEMLEQAVDEGSKQAIADNELKPALRPKVEVIKFDDGADLEFKLDLEVLPEVPEVDLTAYQPDPPGGRGRRQPGRRRHCQSRQGAAHASSLWPSRVPPPTATR